MVPSAPLGAPPGPWWGQDVASVAVFDAALAPYGIWGTHSRFGRVFLPSGLGPGWQPYTRGQWIRDPRFGTVFAGAEPWGWTTYHYGRWGRDDRFGWFWIPDTRFAPPVGLAGAAGGWAAGQADWSRWNGGWNGGWAAPWGGGWGSPWGPGWNAGWHPGWNAGWGGWNSGWRGGWGPGWQGGWHPGWNDRHWRDRERDRRRDRDRDRVDRTRPGESPMAGFVRNRVPPPAPAVPQGSAPVTASVPAAPPSGWTAPQRAGRAPRGDGGAMGSFVRGRVPVDGQASFRREPSSAMVVPPRAVPAEARVVVPQATASQPPPRMERPRPSYQRSAPDYPRSRATLGHDSPQRVGDD